LDDIYKDTIKEQWDLELLWSDFYVTGSKKSIIKITSILENLNKTLPANLNNTLVEDQMKIIAFDYERMITIAVQVSIIFNAYNDSNIYNIIADPKLNVSETVENELKKIISEVDKMKNTK